MKGFFFVDVLVKFAQEGQTPLCKKLLTLLLVLMTMGHLQARVETPQTVDNPRKADAECNIANPNGVLTQAECDTLQALCHQLYQQVGAELCVVALDDIGNATAFDFAVKLFNQWGVGNRKRDTGVMLFLTRQQRDLQLVTGGGIEGVLTDIICSHIIDVAIDSIQAGGGNAYGQGLIAAARQILHYTSDEAARQELMYERSQAENSNPMPWLFCLGGGAIGIGALLHYRKPKCPRCGKRTMKCTGSQVLSEPSPMTSGRTVYHYQCQQCGHRMDRTLEIPYHDPSEDNDDDFHTGATMGGMASSHRSGGIHMGGSFGGGHTYGGGAGRKF